MAIVFAWDEWNREHVKKHGSNAVDAQFVIRHAIEPFPREIGDEKYLVWGQTRSGQYLQVVFAFKVPQDIEYLGLEMLDWSTLIDYAETVIVYIIHAMPLTPRQRSQYHKLRRSQ